MASGVPGNPTVSHRYGPENARRKLRCQGLQGPPLRAKGHPAFRLYPCRRRRPISILTSLHRGQSASERPAGTSGANREYRRTLCCFFARRGPMRQRLARLPGRRLPLGPVKPSSTRSGRSSPRRFPTATPPNMPFLRKGDSLRPRGLGHRDHRLGRECRARQADSREHRGPWCSGSPSTDLFLARGPDHQRRACPIPGSDLRGVRRYDHAGPLREARRPRKSYKVPRTGLTY